MTTAEDPRWTEYLPIGGLIPASRNAKDHDQAALGRSMSAFGFVEPVVLDGRTGRLLAGHGRVDYLTALREKGEPAPDGIVVGDDGEWRVMVVCGVSSESDQHADAMGIALNRVGELGGWKYEDLAHQLDDLVMGTEDLLTASGFSMEDLEDMMHAVGDPPSLDDLEAEFGEPDPAKLWPTLRFKVKPQDRDRYLRLVEGVEGGDDVLFAHLLDLAEK